MLSARGSAPRDVTRVGTEQATIRSRSSTEANSTVSLPLRLAQGDLHPGVEAVGQPGRQVVQSRTAGAPAAAAGGTRGVVAAERHDLLDRAHRQALGDDPLGQPLLAAASSRPSRARAWPADSTPAATRRWTGGGSWSRRSVLEICGRERPIRRGQLVVGAAEVVQQLLVGGGLLQRVELAAVQVLQQGVAQQVVVGRVPDDGRDRRPGRPAGRPASGARP